MLTFKKKTVEFNSRFVSAFGFAIITEKNNCSYGSVRYWNILIPFIAIEIKTKVYSEQPKVNSYEVQ